MPAPVIQVVRQLHPDTFNYLDRVRQAGGSVPEYGVSAHNRFINRLIDAGLWQKIKQGNGLILTLATTDFNGLFVPLIAPTGVTPTNVNFVAGDYAPNTGLNPGSTNSTKYIDFGYNLQTWLSNNSFSASFYCLDNIQAVNNPRNDGYPTCIGARVASGNQEISMTLWSYSGDNNSYYFGLGGLSGAVTTVVGASSGLNSLSRTSTTDLRAYRNGSQVGSTNTSSISENLPNLNLYGFAVNTNGVANFWESKRGSYISALPGLTASEEAIHYQAVQELQTAYNRAV